MRRLAAALLVLLGTLAPAFAQGTCQVQSQDEAQICVDILQAGIQVDEPCSELPSLRVQHGECMAHFSGDCWTNDNFQLVDAIGNYLDTLETDCAVANCASEDEVRACLAPFVSDTVCKVSQSDINQAATCIMDLKTRCPDSATAYQDSLDSTRTEFEDRKQEAACNDEGEAGTTRIDDCIKELSMEIVSNDLGLSFEGTCELYQEYMNCVQGALDEHPELGDTYNLHISQYAQRVSHYGCDDVTLGNNKLQHVPGCNVAAALECYDDTPLAGSISFVLIQGALMTRTSQDQKQMCSKVKAANLANIRQCVDNNMKKCPETVLALQPEGIERELNYVHLKDIQQLEEYCGNDCEDIDDSLQGMRECLQNMDQYISTGNCGNLQTMISCVKGKMGGCGVLQRRYREMAEQNGLAQRASECELSLGVTECTDREEQEDNVKTQCIEGVAGGGSYSSKTELCSAYQSHLNCLLKKSAGCETLTDALVMPGLPLMASLNQYYSCDIQYRGEAVSISGSDRCAKAHYMNCFKELTTALGLPLIEIGDLKTLNFLLSDTGFWYTKFGKCSALTALDTNLIQSCVADVIGACQNSVATEVTPDPYWLSIATIDRNIDSICEEGCLTVTPLTLGECKVDTVNQHCQEIFFLSQRKLNTDSECRELRTRFECAQSKLGSCAFQRDAANTYFGDCDQAALHCFGERLVLKEAPPPSTTPAAATVALPQLGAMLVLLLIAMLV